MEGIYVCDLLQQNVSLSDLPLAAESTIVSNESDDEFCDTSAEITNPISTRHRDFSGSHSTSTLSSTSLNESPSRVTGNEL